MGAWGKEPYANDTACDWFIGAMQDGPLTERIEEALHSGNEDEVRAAAFLLEKVAYGYVYPSAQRQQHIELAVSKLQRMLELEWIKIWDEPEEIRAELRRQIDALRVRLHREDENVLLRKIKEDHMGQPKTSVYDALAWTVAQLDERYADHAETDLPVELRVARAIVEQHEESGA
jgi:hypothetical protein